MVGQSRSVPVSRVSRSRSSGPGHRLRILFLSTWFPSPPDNGSKIRVSHLLRALGRRHRVTLLAFAFGTADPDHTQSLMKHCEQMHVVHQDPHRPTRLAWRLRFFSPVPVAAQPVPAMARLVRETVQGQDFDVVVASTKGMASYALRETAPTVRVLEEHNSSTRQMEERYRKQSSPLSRVRCWISWQKARQHEKRICQRFDLITMVSEQDRSTTRVLLADTPVPIHVLPNGVDCAHNRPGLAQIRPFRLIYNGALTYSANHDAMAYFLSEIYPRIRREIPETSLTITGSLDGIDLSGLALDDSVTLSGHVEDIRPVVAGSAVCVIPLREGGGTRIKILEAMALGTPVISTTKGAEGLKVVDGEHLILAVDPADFAARTVQLLQDGALQRRLAGNARRLVQKQYDWAHIGKRFVELVEDLVQDRRAAP